MQSNNLTALFQNINMKFVQNRFSIIGQIKLCAISISFRVIIFFSSGFFQNCGDLFGDFDVLLLLLLSMTFQLRLFPLLYRLIIGI